MYFCLSTATMATTNWVWQYFSKDDQDKMKVICKLCKDMKRDGKLEFHSTASMINYLKHQHKVKQYGPKGLPFCSLKHIYISPEISGQKTMDSYKTMAVAAKYIKGLMTFRMNILCLYDVPAMPKQKQPRVAERPAYGL